MTAYGQTRTANDRLYALPRGEQPLVDVLAALTEAGAAITFRPDQLGETTVRPPRGRRTARQWLDVLLRDTEFTYAPGAAALLVYRDTELSSQTYNLYGAITDAASGERLIGATVTTLAGQAGSYTNEFGQYSLPLPGGRRRVRISYVGYLPQERELLLRSDSLLDFTLQPDGELPRIIVTAAGADDEQARYLETGTRIGRAEIAQLGGIGGEDDPLQLARLLPGITSGADGIGGMVLRGSQAGNNLILLDGVPLYTLNHAAGVFSVFNNQAIRRMDVYKDALPSRYGGRIGGVVDVHTRDGNLYRNELTLGKSLLASSVTAEGPLRKGESSFLLTGRWFWASELLEDFSRRYKRRRGRMGSTDYDVYDLNFKLNQRVGRRGRVYISLYRGLDDFVNTGWSSDTLTLINEAGAVFVNTTPSLRMQAVRWGNNLASLRYNHIFNERTFGNFRLSYTDLLTQSSFERSDSLNEITAGIYEGSSFSGSYASDIRQVGMAFDGQHSTPDGRLIKFGLQADWHRFRIGLTNQDAGLNTLPEEDTPVRQTPRQLATYGSLEGRWGELYYRAGLRLAYWRGGETAYLRASPRLLLAGPLSARTDWQLSYDRNVQPVHLLNSFVIAIPSDSWLPAGENIAPASAQQYAAKLRARPGQQWRGETGLYYRRMRDLITYAEGRGADPNWFENLSFGRGRAYGWETMLQRTRGRLRGWLSYTLARSERTFDAQINQGNTFPFRYDRRHSLSALLIYQIGARTTLSGSFRYESGLAYSLALETLTVPLEGFEGGEPIVDERNGFRMPANHRLDLNLRTQLGKPEGRLRHSLDLGIYNVYNRRNPLYYEARTEYTTRDSELRGRTQFYQIFIAPLLPSLRYELTIGDPIFGR